MTSTPVPLRMPVTVASMSTSAMVTLSTLAPNVMPLLKPEMLMFWMVTLLAEMVTPSPAPAL